MDSFEEDLDNLVSKWAGLKSTEDLIGYLELMIYRLKEEATMTENSTPKVYLAARYSRHPEMRDVRADLEKHGWSVTSRWINGGHELTKEGSTEAHAAERVRYAQEDTADLLAADIVISFTEEPRKTTTRGGRHVEFGMALALGKAVYVVGHRENVFHTLPQVRFFPAWSLCFAQMRAERCRP